MRGRGKKSPRTSPVHDCRPAHALAEQRHAAAGLDLLDGEGFARFHPVGEAGIEEVAVGVTRAVLVESQRRDPGGSQRSGGAYKCAVRPCALTTEAMAEDHDAGTGHVVHRDCDSVTAHLTRFRPLDSSHH
jgi:hypothetical protein